MTEFGRVITQNEHNLHNGNFQFIYAMHSYSTTLHAHVALSRYINVSEYV